jgi:hypothetical protein
MSKRRVGRRCVQLSFSTTPAVHEELKMWAEVAGWSVSKTIDVLIAEGMRSYDRPRLPLEAVRSYDLRDVTDILEVDSEAK